MARLSIGARLWMLVGGLLLALLAAVAGALVLQHQAVQVLRSVHADRLVPLAQLKAVSDAFAVDVVDAVHKVRDGALHATEGAARIEQARVQADAQWRAYLGTEITPEERALIEIAAPLRLRADGAAAQAAALMAAPDRRELDRFAAAQLYPAIDPLSAAIARLVRLQEQVASDLLSRSIERSHVSEWLLPLLALGVVAAALGWSWHIVRSVTRPLAAAVRVAEAVARGQLQTRIEATAGDEIGQLLAAVDRMRGSLVELVDTDALTGLLTRRRFDALVEAEASRATRGGAAWSVLMIDLDHFKHINDSHGHAGGDAALRAAAQAVRATLRGHDSPARYGGEEFGVLLPGADAAVAVQVAERVRRAVESAEAIHAGRRIRVTCSIGVATCGGPGATSSPGVIERADAALYAAKDAGRNRVMTAESLAAAAAIIRAASGA